MKKKVQIVTIPCKQPSYLLKVLTNGMHYNGRVKGMIEVHDSPWGTDTEFEAQQLLVLSDDVIRIGDQCISKNFKHLYFVEHEETADIANTLECFKIIASYPQLEGTLPLSKETIQQWIDNGTPGEGSVDLGKFYTGNYIGKCKTCDKEYIGDKRWYWCKECSEKQLVTDSQGNLILEFVPERKSAITVKTIVPTDEEIEEKAAWWIGNQDIKKENLDEENEIIYAYTCGYQEALKDLGYVN